MKDLLNIFVLGAALVLTAPAAMAAEKADDIPKPACFKVKQLTGWVYLDDYHVMFKSQFLKENYLTTFKRKCRSAKFAMAVHPTFARKLVCEKPILEYVNMDDDSCRVSSVQKVTDLNEARAIAEQENAQRTAEQAARKDSAQDK